MQCYSCLAGRGHQRPIHPARLHGVHVQVRQPLREIRRGGHRIGHLHRG